MPADRVQRKMAAILAADVAGYSRLMGKDEEATLATLKTCREIVDSLIAGYGGRIFGSAGDSVIAEFGSPVDAVRCATEIQLAVDKQNSAAPEDRRMRFRIGINLGDVVADGDNLMGDGVNVAARLEALAPPGGICVSEAIHVQVRDRLPLEFLDLGEHKVKNIARPVRVYRVPLASEYQIKSPFRGLKAFEFDDVELFFGRAHAIGVCMGRLEQLAAEGKPFLLIYGMSGSGKSSLLRAGLLPAITQGRALAGTAAWRRCVIRPSEGPDAVASLVAGLLAEGALPELLQSGDPAELSQLFRDAPQRAPAAIRAALEKAARSTRTPASQMRLLIAIDQMEELFTAEANPAALVGILALLVSSGFVWAIGTIRADFFHRCGEVPCFSALKDGLSSYELLPPSGPEIAQIIREPARAAGLRFEEDAEQGRLDDVLQEAAAADPGSLPLLEFVLDALYEAGRERRLLTFAAYRALGGLEGAIARRADEIVEGLPTDIEDALPVVLRSLTTVRLGEETVTARPALRSEVAGSPAQAALVDTLIAARLLVSDENAEGQAVVRLAHEALLSRWPRARAIVNANREFLETRARVQADARRWHSDRKNPELLLPPGKRLAEAEEVLLARRDEIDDRIIEYIEASSVAERAAAEKERQAERARIEAEETAKRERLEREAERRSLEAAAATRLARRTRIAAGIALLLAIGAGAGAVVGYRGQQEAVRQTQRAEQNAGEAQAAAVQARTAEAQALEAKDQALRNQSLSLSLLSQQIGATGETEAAILLALEALPSEGSASDRPYLVEAAAALYNALLAHRESMVLRHGGGVTHAAFDPSGGRIVTSSFDSTARIWDSRTGAEMAVLRGHEATIERAAFSPDGRLVVTAGRDGTARVWNANSGEQVHVLNQPGYVNTAVFSPDGTRVLTTSEDGSIALWDSVTGEKVISPEITVISRAAFSPDGHSFAAGLERHTVQVWSSNDGKLISNLDVQTWPDDVSFSPDGSRLIVGSRWQATMRKPSRLWDVSKGIQIATFTGHRSDTNGAVFSPNGHLVATVSIDGSARLWDGISGESRGELGHESEGLRIRDRGLHPRDQESNATFSPNNRLLVTISLDRTVQIWAIENMSELAAVRGHTGLIEHVEFSPDGSRLLTASHDGTARLWNIDGALTSQLTHSSPPTFAAFSRDGAQVLTVSEDGKAHVWDVESGSELATLGSGEGDPLQYAEFSPDGRRVATASRGGRMVVWGANTGRKLAEFNGHTSEVRHVQFSPTGDSVLSTSLDGTARIWDASTGAQVRVLDPEGALRNAFFSPDGRLFIAGSNDGTVRLWNADGTPFNVLTGRKNKISVIALSTDGQMLATGSFDGTAQLWSMKDGGDPIALNGHDGSLVDIEFSRDGRSIVTASGDRTARIWNAADGAEEVTLSGHDGAVTSAVFSPDGQFVATTSAQDRTARLWAADSGRQIAILIGRENQFSAEPAPMSALFSADGAHVAVVSGDDSVRIIRVFQSPQQLIDFAQGLVTRELTPCERQRFFLPVKGEMGECPN
jgi:WD40 repeat protein/class 3 adenylate cyclase